MDKIMKELKVTELAARFMVIRLRKTQPELAQTWIPPPSTLLPMLTAWWAVFARQKDGRSTKLLLDRPQVREKYNRLEGLIKQGRFHDDRPVEEMSEQIGTQSV